MKFIIFATILLIIVILNESRRKMKTCNKYTEKMNDEKKKLIIDTHNNIRNQMAFKTYQSNIKLHYATNMIQMYWDERLAAKAQEWADQCMNRHSSQEFRAYSKNVIGDIGENILSVVSTTKIPEPDWVDAIGQWFNQIEVFEYKSLKKFKVSGKHTEFFTQLIWAESYLLGCGFSISDTADGQLSFYVCHYGPGGNVPGKPVYNRFKIHPICRCSKGMSCGNPKYLGLCCPNGFCGEEYLTYDGKPFPPKVNKSFK